VGKRNKEKVKNGQKTGVVISGVCSPRLAAFDPSVRSNTWLISLFFSF
jgi:hypothetical protein